MSSVCLRSRRCSPGRSTRRPPGTAAPRATRRASPALSADGPIAATRNGGENTSPFSSSVLPDAAHGRRRDHPLPGDRHRLGAAGPQRVDHRLQVGLVHHQLVRVDRRRRPAALGASSRIDLEAGAGTAVEPARAAQRVDPALRRGDRASRPRRPAAAAGRPAACSALTCRSSACTRCSAARTVSARLAMPGARSSVPRESRALAAKPRPATRQTTGTSAAPASAAGPRFVHRIGSARPASVARHRTVTSCAVYANRDAPRSTHRREHVPKSKVRKKPDAPRGRSSASSRRGSLAPSPTWYPVVMVVVLLLGLAYMVVYYLTSSGTTRTSRSWPTSARGTSPSASGSCCSAWSWPCAGADRRVHSVVHACDYTPVIYPQLGKTLWTTRPPAAAAGASVPDRRYTALAAAPARCGRARRSSLRRWRPARAAARRRRGGGPAGYVVQRPGLLAAARRASPDGLVVRSPLTAGAAGLGRRSRTSAPTPGIRHGLRSTTLEIDAGAVLVVLSRRAWAPTRSEAAALVAACPAALTTAITRWRCAARTTTSTTSAPRRPARPTCSRSRRSAPAPAAARRWPARPAGR